MRALLYINMNMRDNFLDGKGINSANCSYLLCMHTVHSICYTVHYTVPVTLYDRVMCSS